MNGWIGPELPGDDSSQRTLVDLVASVKVTGDLELGFEGDLGRQELPGAPDAEWTALIGYLRYRFSPRSAVALRLEQFDDPGGGISGLAQTLEEGTLTLEHRPHERLIVKLEGRYDRSTARVFAGETADAPERDQFLAVLATLFTF